MDSCLLCLEINKDILDCIRVNSTRWQELDIVKTIEKYFWSMTTIQTNSWICLPCWREVNSFHNFYLRIEEAHVNFGRIKVEDCVVPVECKEELSGKYGEELDKALCFLEPEILIDQTQPHDLPKSHDLLVNTETPLTEPLDKFDLDNMPLKLACKRLRLQSGITSKDPLKKSKKSKKKKTSKAKVTAEEIITGEKKLEHSKVKEEPIDLDDNNDTISASDHENEGTDFSYGSTEDLSETAECKNRKAYNKQRTTREENDKFIAEHFKQMFCDICQTQFDEYPIMQKHFTDVHKQRGYVVCCKRKFFNRTRLVDHIHCHLNPDHFKCNECGKAMSDRFSFDSHMLRVHRANEVVKQHCCDVCGKSFTKAYVLRNHKLTHLPEEEKKFPCSDCGKNYGSSYLLNQHIQAVHLKRFVKICYICGKALNSSAEFKVHMNKHEGIPLPVINCDICGLRLTSVRGLKLHKESQHPVGGNQEHQCPICPKISPNIKALKKHINTMHQKGYDHKCSICEKAFKRTEALREHMATHTGTSLYTCPWCPKTFNSNGNMHAHRKKVHPKEWEESKLQKYSGNIPPEI